MRSMWWLRFLIIGLGATLGVVLLVSGNALIGALVLALAVTRLVMVLGMRRRRRAMMARWQPRRSSPGPWSSTSTG
jgi:hypothetical protein